MSSSIKFGKSGGRSTRQLLMALVFTQALIRKISRGCSVITPKISSETQFSRLENSWSRSSNYRKTERQKNIGLKQLP
jgi:hypothetical protein